MIGKIQICSRSPWAQKGIGRILGACQVSGLPHGGSSQGSLHLGTGQWGSQPELTDVTDLSLPHIRHKEHAQSHWVGALSTALARLTQCKPSFLSPPKSCITKCKLIKVHSFYTENNVNIMLYIIISLSNTEYYSGENRNYKNVKLEETNLLNPSLMAKTWGTSLRWWC